MGISMSLDEEPAKKKLCITRSRDEKGLVNKKRWSLIQNATNMPNDLINIIEEYLEQTVIKMLLTWTCIYEKHECILLINNELYYYHFRTSELTQLKCSTEKETIIDIEFL